MAAYSLHVTPHVCVLKWIISKWGPMFQVANVACSSRMQNADACVFGARHESMVPSRSDDALARNVCPILPAGNGHGFAEGKETIVWCFLSMDTVRISSHGL